MANNSTTPSTVGGIKRLAKSIKRERGISHHAALNQASIDAGYQNYAHASDVLSSTSGPRQTPLYEAYLSAYFAGKQGYGRETMTIHLSRPLDQVVARHELSRARNLTGFKLEALDHLELAGDTLTVEDARKQILSAARTLQFMAATGLRPATTAKSRRPMRALDRLPGRDHPSLWVSVSADAWVYLDEPYEASLRNDVAAARLKWCRDRGYSIAMPHWPGLYFPGMSTPWLITQDQAKALQLENVLSAIPADAANPDWTGESAGYYTHFKSPARLSSGKPRKTRPMPHPRGHEQAGAIAYGGQRGAELSSWRPAERMPLDLHLQVGPLLHGLNNSPINGTYRKVISRLRSTLDDWLQMEYPSEEEMSSEQFRQAYYGEHREPILEQAKQVAALVHVQKLIKRGYNDCAPRKQMLKDFARVEAAISTKIA